MTDDERMTATMAIMREIGFERGTPPPPTKSKRPRNLPKTKASTPTSSPPASPRPARAKAPKEARAVGVVAAQGVVVAPPALAETAVSTAPW